jgi:tRNA1Val (adenine37-N6)-methyltransferase
MKSARRPGPPNVSEDTLFDGAISLAQPARGYRVNVDSLLLAGFARGQRPASSTVDLGAGVGAVALALVHLGAAARVALVEKDPVLAELARRNLLENRVDGQVHVADVAHLPRELHESADLVVCNPPYHEPSSGRPRRDTLDGQARSGALVPFMAAARKASTGKSARALFVYPARALAELVVVAREHGLVPKRMRLVHSRREASARLALVELRRARPGGLTIEPALIEWSAPGVRAPEVAALLSRQAVDRR